MARDDWEYPPVHNSMIAGLLYIVEHEGHRLGVNDRLTLIRKIIADYLAAYEKEKGIKLPTEVTILPDKSKAYKPLKHK